MQHNRPAALSIPWPALVGSGFYADLVPFTPSHIAAVLPLRGVAGLPLAALAAGSISPDVPYFLPGLSSLGNWTHQPWALVSIDVAIGLVAWVLWRSAAASLHELSPAGIRQRWRPARWNSAKWWMVLLALISGATTHVVWDSFTHPGRLGSQLWFLAASYPGPLGDLAGYRYAQYLSGVIGLAILIWVGLRQPKRPLPQARRGPVVLLVAAAATSAIAGAALRIFHSGAITGGVGELLFAGLTGGLAAASLSVALIAWGHSLGQARASTRLSLSSTDPPIS